MGNGKLMTTGRSRQKIGLLIFQNLPIGATSRARAVNQVWREGQERYA
jgi:hypothetical protein